MAIHITLEKNAGANMIHTEDQTIRTIIVFVQVQTILDVIQCRDSAGHPSMNGRMIPLGGSLFQNFLKL